MAFFANLNNDGIMAKANTSPKVHKERILIILGT